MNGALQNRIKPHSSPNSTNIGTGKVREAFKAVDGNGEEVSKTSFKDLLMNSNSDMSRKRAAMKNGDDLSTAKTDEEFFQMLSKKNDQKVNPTGPKKELDKDAFLKLFVTQLQNQDPLNPDDSAKMASQLAQFNSLEQMQNVNKNLEKMSGDQATGRAVDLIDFVGKEIKLSGGRLKLKEGKLTDAHFGLQTPVSNAALEVRNGAGIVVAKKGLGSLEKGDHPVSWNGMGKDGKPVRDGVYTFAIVANNDAGEDIPVSITSTVKVTGVDMKENGGSFYTELGKVGVHEVDSVGEQGFVSKVRDAEGTVEAAKKAAEEGADQAVDRASKAVGAASGNQEQAAPQQTAEQPPTPAIKPQTPQPAPASPSGDANTSEESSDRDHSSHS